MCIHMNSDVILANLLLYSPKANDGIDVNDINNYCNKLWAKLHKESKSVSFHINNNELEFSVRSRPRYFKKFCGKYYKGLQLEYLNIFENLVSDPDVKGLMKSIAEEVV